MILYWWRTLYSPQLTIKYRWIWTIKSWHLQPWWSTIDVELLIVHSWLSSVDRSEPSRIDLPKLDDPLLMVNSWQSTVDHKVLMDLDHQELTVQILIDWMLMGFYCWFILGSPLLTINRWSSSIDRSGPSRVNIPNIYGVDVDAPLVLVNS